MNNQCKDNRAANYQGQRNNQPRTGNYNNYPIVELPKDYLKDGYFNLSGNLKDELLLDYAESIARAIGNHPGGIANSQLRKFYGHVRMADARLIYEAPYEAVKPSILELSVFVAEAKGKNKVPQVFKDFIDRNLKNVTDEKAFRQGFVKHFQAVVGYFTYIYPRA